jgi:hypothetical protein
MDLRIRIRIHPKKSWIRNTGTNTFALKKNVNISIFYRAKTFKVVVLEAEIFDSE